MIMVGVADTTFARVDMAKFVKEEFSDSGRPVKVSRYTVPGVKDLPAAAKRLFDKGCELVMALGMPGAAEIDKECANQASLGIMMVQAITGKHVIEVFVYEDEAKEDEALFDMVEDRTRKHARNALKLLFEPDSLTELAGLGLRQGGPDAGPLRL